MVKKITFKIWILIIALVLSLLAIFGMPPSFLQKGIQITSVTANSTAFLEGLRQGQIILSINGQTVNNVNEYSAIMSKNFPSQQEQKLIIETKDSEYILFSNNAPDIIVQNIPKTKIKLGLDLVGGAKALVKAENKSLSASEVNDLVSITRNRLNEFGLTDLVVSSASDFSGNHFMDVEIAGATPSDLEKLISEQGKFEAKIGNDTVFIGGNRDIASVGRDAQTSRIELCDTYTQGGYICKFSFAVTLGADAAKRHADITANLSVNQSSQGNYLSKSLDLYLDDKFVDSLQISEDLKGRVTTQISISGSGTGATQQEAYASAQQNMKQLQTILITGSLPFKLEIVKIDTISPALGNSFLKLILLAGLASIVGVSIIIFVRYRKFKASIYLLITSFSEIIIILGVASIINWNLDLLSLAGILATIGTGIDQQIIILDEAKEKVIMSMKEKLKRAFSIIIGAYFASFVSLIPLLWAGAGLLKGFAITTIIGITVGILITRPAFTDMVRFLEKE
jgi:preprotein translocase subunit SecD